MFIAGTRSIAAGLAALLCSTTVLAAGPGKGSVSRQGFEVGNCAVDRMTVKYKLDSLLGEPTVAGTYRWAGDGSCELHYSTTVWLKLEAGNSHGYVHLAPVVPDPGEWGYNTTGSPDWDEAVCGYKGTEKGRCMTPDQAKHMWKNARVTTFEVAVDADAINRSSSSGGYEASSGGSGDNAQSLSERRAAGLAKQYYDRQGQWAGQYVMANATDIRLVRQSNGRVRAHIRYRYECVVSDCAGTQDAGYDQRIFDLTRGSNGWRVVNMGDYMSGNP